MIHLLLFTFYQIKKSLLGIPKAILASRLTQTFFDGSRIILQILAASLTTHHFKIKNRYHTVIPVTSGHNPIVVEGQLESQIIIFNAGPSSIEAQVWMDWKGKVDKVLKWDGFPIAM